MDNVQGGMRMSKSVDQRFNDWFDRKYPEGSLGNQPIMREAFKEVAYNSWVEALCHSKIRFDGKRDKESGKIEFFFPEN